MTQKIDTMKILKETERVLYVDKDVVKSAPQNTGKIEFFRIGKYISDNDLETEYKSRGLKPASLSLLCEYDRVHRDILDDKEYVCTHWKDAEGKWCFATFSRWHDERHVDVNRNGHDWYDYWWFAGVRKLGLSTKTSELLEPKNSALESAIKLVKKEGYVIYKPI